MSNSNQEIIEERLASYVDGELEDANERLAIEQHLQQNPQYRHLLDDLTRQRDMLRNLPREAAPTDLADALNGQLERSGLLDGEPAGGNRMRMRIPAFSPMLAAAAIVFLTLGLGIIIFFVLPTRNSRSIARGPANPAPAGSFKADETPAPIEKSTADKLDDLDAKGAPETAASTPPSVALGDDRAARARGLIHEKTSDKQSIEQLQFTEKRADSRRAEAVSSNAESRDAELDELAKSVSNDPHVRDLLAGGSVAELRASSEPAETRNAVVMVVRAGDAQQVQQQLGRFFAQSNVNWQPAPRTVQLALNTSLSQQGGKNLNDGENDNPRQISPEAVESGEQRPERKNQKDVADAVGAPAFKSALQVPAAAAPPAASTPAVTAKLGTEASLAKGGAPQQFAKSSAAAAQDGGIKALFDRGTHLPHDQLGESRPTDFAANTTLVNHLYIARRLSPQQARQLTECLTRTGDLRQANVTIEQEETKPDAKTGLAPANAPTNGVANTPVAAAPAPEGLVPSAEADRGALTDNQQPAVPGAIGTDALRQAGEIGAAEPQNAGRDGASDKFRAAAALKPPAQNNGIVRSDASRAGADAPAKPQAAFGGASSTQPAPAAGEDASLVDVVIVVQNDSAVNGILAEPGPESGPTTTPTTQP